MVDIQSATAEIRRGKKEEERKKHDKIQCPHLLRRAAIVNIMQINTRDIYVHTVVYSRVGGVV